MITSAIKQIELFKITDEDSGSVTYGFDQEWYRMPWQRMAGCGPTTVAGILYYLCNTHAGFGSISCAPTRKSSAALMQDVWKHVTPTMRGIPSTDILIKGIESFAQRHRLDMGIDFIDIGKQHRPDLATLLGFISQSLRNDVPVAFLNLNNGGEKKLYSWHWVTIVSLTCSEDGGSAFVQIMDEGRLIQIDFALWLRTTTLGGGLVSFCEARTAGIAS